MSARSEINEFVMAKVLSIKKRLNICDLTVDEPNKQISDRKLVSNAIKEGNPSEGSLL